MHGRCNYCQPCSRSFFCGSSGALFSVLPLATLYAQSRLKEREWLIEVSAIKPSHELTIMGYVHGETRFSAAGRVQQPFKYKDSLGVATRVFSPTALPVPNSLCSPLVTETQLHEAHRSRPWVKSIVNILS